MSADARFFRVGVFVFLGSVAIASCAVLVGGGGLFQQQIVFETVFNESVQGLETGAPVKVRGVQIGSVSQIGFVSDFYSLREDVREHLRRDRLVLVRMKFTPIESDLVVDTEGRQQIDNLQEMIDSGLRMRLAQQGITGVAFVQADFLDPAMFPPMKVSWEPEVMYVPSAPSTIATITTAAERIAAKLEQADLDQVIRNLDTLLVSLNDKVSAVDAQGISRNAEEALEQANATMARVQRLVDGGRYDLQSSLENLRVATENLRALSETAREYPSLVILGQPPKQSEAVKP